MKLTRLGLENFRQFYGKQDIEFSDDEEKNITLIHGENGVGKTALLNAVMWCFFRKTTPKFEMPEKILCNQAEMEGNTFVCVDVEFEHEGEEFRVFRSQGGVITKEVFKVQRIIDGNYVDLSGAKGILNTILPSDMADYFFFDGEGISNIAAEKSTGNAFRKAVRDILGFTIAEKIQDDLAWVKRKWERRQTELAKKNASMKEGAKKLDKFRKELDKINLELKGLEKDIKESWDAKGRAEEALRKSKHTSAKDAQKRIDTFQSSKDQSTKNLNNFKERKQTLVQTYGWVIFAHKLEVDALEFIDESGQRGRIPAPYDKQLIDDLVDAGECICGRKLVKGSKPFDAVLEKIGTASTGSINTKVQKARGVFRGVSRLTKDFLNEVDDIETKLAEQERLIGGFEKNYKMPRMI